MKTSHLTLIGAALLLAAAAASAHTGQGTHGLTAGFAHPFGLDHLLAMVAVGLWSAAALPKGRRATGPLVFMLSLLGGAGLGAIGFSGSLVEYGISASVALFGAMLFAPRALPPALGLSAIATAAVLHGLAHGAELPAVSGFAPYALGFLLTTAALHAIGLSAGNWLAHLHAGIWRVLGTTLGITGLVLMAQI